MQEKSSFFCEEGCNYTLKNFKQHMLNSKSNVLSFLENIDIL